MTTYYYQPLPQLPQDFLKYCSGQNYPLTIKKQYIIAQLLSTPNYTDIDTLQSGILRSCSNISRSSIYHVLQWMGAHGLVIKTQVDDNLNILYKINADNLYRLNEDSSKYIHSRLKQAEFLTD